MKKINYLIFIWHSFFLAITMSMLDLNTVFPSLVNELVDSKIVFGLLYSLMLGVPLVFNIIFSHYLQHYHYKRGILLLGIYLRAFSFLGMALFVYFFYEKPALVIASLFFWIIIFSLSGGFAGLVYSDIIGKLFHSSERGRLFATKQVASGVAALLGSIIIARIFTPGKFSFPLNYTVVLFVGFAGLTVATIAFWFIKEPPSIIKNREREPLKLFIKRVPELLHRDSNLFRFIIIENMTSFSLMILPFYMVFARDRFAIADTYVGRYLLFQTIGAIVSNVFWGFLSNRGGSRIVVRFCILIGGIIPIIAILISNLGPDYYVIIFILIGFVISGRHIGFETCILDIAPEEERTVYLGVRGTLNILKVIMPLIGSLFIEYTGYHITFFLVSAVMLTAFFLAGKRMGSESY